MYISVLIYLCDPADLAFVCGTVAGSRQRALLDGASTVQGDKRGRAQVKWIVGVVVQLVGVRQGLLTSSQNFAGLNGRESYKIRITDEKIVSSSPFDTKKQKQTNPRKFNINKNLRQ